MRMRSIHRLYLEQLTEQRRALHRVRLGALALAALCAVMARVLEGWEFKTVFGALFGASAVSVYLVGKLLRELQDLEADVRALEERYAQKVVAMPE
jgi:hypothetical protein